MRHKKITGYRMGIGGGVGFETEGQGWMRIAYFVNEWINIYVYTLFRLQGRGAQLHEPVERCWGGDPQERQVYTGPTTQTVRICTVYEQYSTVQYSTVHSTSNLFLCDHFIFCFFVILIVYL